MNNKCIEINCNKEAIYSISKNVKANYCILHKKENMFDVRHKLCIVDSCRTRANYNLKDEKYGIYCAKHKKEGMIDIINKKCIELDCNKQPRYNFKGDKKGLYCATHKKEGMIDIYQSYCLEENCNTFAVFNYINEKNGIYCTTHKKEGMIDIKTSRCKEPDCLTQPIFNYPHNKKGLYCLLHKKENMIDVKNIMCIELDCNKRATYGNEKDITPLYCSIHKKNNMIDVRHNKCKTSMCDTIPSSSKYRGYCIRCFIHLFPYDTLTNNYKTKEKEVVNYIKIHFDNFTIISDKKIQDGCSKRRPDILIDLGYQVIIIEIDENQHHNYDCSCENKRIMELSQDVGHRPIIFIRFNPDDYLDKNNNKITSCWSINKKGICTIKKTKLKEWTVRLELLKDMVTYWLNNKSDKTIEIIQLFYNQNI